MIVPAPTTAFGGDWLTAADWPTERAAAGNASTAIAATRSLSTAEGICSLSDPFVGGVGFLRCDDLDRRTDPDNRA